MEAEPFNAPSPAGLSEEALERGRSYRTAWRQLRGTQPAAPDADHASAQQDPDGIFWVTPEGSEVRPNAWADLEAKRQYLADLFGAGHAGTAPQPQPRPPSQHHSEAHQDADDRPVPGTTQRDGDEHATAGREESAPSYEELGAWTEDHPDTVQAVQRRIAQVQEATRLRLEQAAAALAAPLPDRRKPPAPTGRAGATLHSAPPATPTLPRHPLRRSTRKVRSCGNPVQNDQLRRHRAGTGGDSSNSAAP
ncbi:hypothetical protein [Streptomyces nigra]|uniref:hypothetical protein n=1 Tax=Streptomyces nigra TaxID=1827580 RepID=UPI0038248542